MTTSKAILLATALLMSSFSIIAAAPSAAAATHTITLYGAAVQGWGFGPNNMSNPGPSLTVTGGDTVNLRLFSDDSATHTWFIDFNSNLAADSGEPASASFSSSTVAAWFNFTVPRGHVGSYTYRCSIHPTTMTGSITILAGPPAASFTFSPSSPQVGQSVSFDASASVAGSGTITSYAWTFGDGATGTGVTASHTYASAGTFAVNLTVTDSGSKTGTATHSVLVSAPPPNIVLYGSAAQGWGFGSGNMSNPGPTLRVATGANVKIELVSVDHEAHRFFIDLNGNGATFDANDTGSPTFGGTQPAVINWTFNVATAGTYNYYCSIHGTAMRGTIIVGSGGTTTPPSGPDYTLYAALIIVVVIVAIAAAVFLRRRPRAPPAQPPQQGP